MFPQRQSEVWISFTSRRNWDGILEESGISVTISSTQLWKDRDPAIERMPGDSETRDWGHVTIGQGAQGLPGHHQGLGESREMVPISKPSEVVWASPSSSDFQTPSFKWINFNCNKVWCWLIQSQSKDKLHACLPGTQLLGFTPSFLSLLLYAAPHATQSEHVASWLRQMTSNGEKSGLLCF